MKIYTLVSFIFLSTSLFSQNPGFVEKELVIGDSIMFGKCPNGNNFNHIDWIQKTRFVNDSITYDSISGEGFYKSFFQTETDLDGKRLPCKYAEKKYKIIAFEIFNDKDSNTERRVLFVQLENKNTIAWIELDKALETGELMDY